ncbi:RNA polymerase 1-4 RNA polymerase I large subunit [Ectocarpus siliculosus]|uniref:DNA-directed RNA polymerase subunit n=1 Tax=Ectocarpus siliculosus TaxID=2880 RepID=D7FNY1_ECTSI|nr:RNA polymerase 1-4 RNA polymerase I large subunit [Ectocarpus siliculosus]|eukprot:CBJ30250.1 RNA polymerase 1-4 RNA polymerase I large subunit [Ectocarpus siliculosus]
MSHDRTVIRHAVEEIGFGFLTDDDIRRLSVKRITSPVTFDTLNNPLPGGLYDPVLGPVDKMMMCETCGQDQKNCPGHMGHIELAVSVYHPILFGALYKLLRAKCFSCHNLRLSKSKTRVAAVKMMLVDAGRAQEALELDATLLGYLKDGARDHDVLDGNTEDTLVSATKYRDHVLGCLEEDLAGAPRAEWCGGHNRQLRRQLAENLIKAMGACKRCENCGAFSPNIRKDGSNKLFQVPLSDKNRMANQSCNTQIVSAVQRRDPGKPNEDPGDDSDPMSEDSDSDDGDNLEDDDVGGSAPSSKVVGVSLAAAQAAAGDPATKTGAQAHKFMPPIEVELQMQQLWKLESSVLDLIFVSGRRTRSAPGDVNGPPSFSLQNANDLAGGSISDGYRLFFVRALAVPPPRFRPPMNMGDMIAEHPQNVYLTKVLNLNESLKNAASLKGKDLASVLTTWVELQTTVNCYMDSSKDPRGLKDTPPGLRQVLEKKEGLFRKHMMGKRVNYACRSVISPDPYVGTTEIGIPLRFAKELTYPQPVADWNVEAMRQLVENGTSVYPGANFVEDSSGRMLHLDRLSDLKRRGVAARLLSSPGQKVWRHLTDGDCMLVNRQPTLHKPGIMAHRVRVLRNPGYQTIRMHYANCNTYNADFDGDEINCHLPQNELAKAEANLLAFTDEQYLVPTNGKPLRGLIQDHVDAGVKMCSKDCFFTRGEYQQLLYQALSGLPGLEIVPPSDDITTLPPAILKPQQRWTGKQVMSTILRHLTKGLPQLNLDGKSRTPKVAFGEAEQEHVIVFREGELLQGVLDKGAFGSSEFGLVHAVHEVYGSTAAGKLLTALGRVLTIFLQSSGHTCGIEDLTLTGRAEGNRREIINKSLGIGQRSMRELVETVAAEGQDAKAIANGAAAEEGHEDTSKALVEAEVESIRQKTASFLLGEDRDTRLAEIDRHMQSALAPVSSDIIKACLPGGQAKPFPHNCFSLMVLTGAKGSMVNHSQVSCALGQQALEGRRVPVMVSGKSLPSFQAFEPSPRANGFITDRFLTGIRPQEYYFHCMAGREGLVDTAVKTSRSGYLQRCLVKHLEELKVGYDNTVRDGEGCVHQFLYGEDGVDTTQTKYLSSKQLGFLAQNYQALRHKHGITPSFKKDSGFDSRDASRAHSEIATCLQRRDDAAANPSSSCAKFVAGEMVLAKRRAVLKRGEGWGKAELLAGWHSAEVVKVRNAGTPAALYSVRIPLVAAPMFW